MNKKTLAITIITLFVTAAMVCGLLFVSFIEERYRVPENQNDQGEIRAAVSYEEIYRLVMASQPQGNNLINKLFGDQTYVWEDEDYDEYDEAKDEFYLNDYSVESESDLSYGDAQAEKDGYIYCADYTGTFNIYDIENNFVKTQVVTDTLDFSFGIEQVNIYGNYLILMGGSSSEPNEETVILVYDISNPLNPVKVSENNQEGSLDFSIIKDGYLYVDSICWKNDFSREDCVPKVNDSALEASDVYYAGAVNAPYYNVLTSMNLAEGQTYKDEIAIIGNSTENYLSENAFYFSAGDDNQGTEVIKFIYDNGGFEPAGSATVKGEIPDSFSMNEYGGNLRVYSINGNETSSLYIFDEDMKSLGMTDNLKTKNELSSIRFMGNAAAVIEYLNDSSVCILDLRNPNSPEIIDSRSLKGFTGYIYMLDSSRVVTLYNENEKLKISDFDISDPENISENDSLVLENYDYSPVTVMSNLVFMDTENLRMGFAVENTYEYEGFIVDYVMISYNEETGMEKVYNGNVYDSNVDGDDYSYLGSDVSYSTRTVLKGESFYLFTDELKATEIDYTSLVIKNIYDLFEDELYF